MQKHTDEIWKDVKGYEGLYQVSNKGNVRRIGAHRYAFGEYFFDKSIKPLSPIKKENGYMYVSLSLKRKRKNFFVHRLVAETFIPNPENLPQVNHKDFTRDNNCVENLEWCTAQYNTLYSKDNWKCWRNVSTKSGRKYITIRGGRYRVCIYHVTEKSFIDLDEAIRFRNQFIDEELWAL